MITLRTLSERILRIYGGFAPGADIKVDTRDIQRLVLQVLNGAIRKDYFEAQLPLLDHTPSAVVLATYDNIPVQGITQGLPLDATLLSAVGFSSANIDVNGETWVDELGNPWVVPYSRQRLEVSPIQSNEAVFAVRLHVTWPADVDPQGVRDFVAAIPDEGLLHLAGGTAGVPSYFLKAGIRNVVVTDQYIQFAYEPDAAKASNQEAVRLLKLSHQYLRRGPQVYTAVLLSNLEQLTVPADLMASSTAGCLLPCQPIRLPRGLGVWRVYSPLAPTTLFIPLQPTESAVIEQIVHNGLRHALGDVYMYEWMAGDRLTFGVPLSEFPFTELSVQLVVADPDTLGEYDPLPMPADYEDAIVREVLQLLGAAPAADLVPDRVQN